MEQILVVGYFGAGNVGDEAILEAIAQEFRRRRPGIRIMATQAGDRWGAGADIPPVSLLDVDALSAAVSESSAVLFGCGGDDPMNCAQLCGAVKARPMGRPRVRGARP